jgi:hypothetical protein
MIASTKYTSLLKTEHKKEHKNTQFTILNYFNRNLFVSNNKLLGHTFIRAIKKAKLSMYRPWKPLGLREVEAPTFSDIRLIDGGKVVSPTHRQLFSPRKIPGTHFC